MCISWVLYIQLIKSWNQVGTSIISYSTLIFLPFKKNYKGLVLQRYHVIKKNAAESNFKTELPGTSGFFSVPQMSKIICLPWRGALSSLLLGALFGNHHPYLELLGIECVNSHLFEI